MKTIIPSNISDTYAKLEVPLGSKLPSDGDTLT